MTAQHDALIDEWRRNAQKHDDRNFRFLRSLKMVSDPDRVDQLAREIHAEAFSKIECTRCAHCCKTMKPHLTEEDIDRIAGHFGLSKDAFVTKYLEPDPEDGGHRTNAAPCPFLGGDDRCTIYEVRPRACREFPHTDKEEFSSRTYLHSANTLSCPAVYFIVERMRKRLRR
jgi:Fe-S-cluster containining protein